MKKIVCLAILLLALSSVSVLAAPTEAGIAGTYTAPSVDGSINVGSTQKATVKLSKNVMLAYEGQATGLGYSVGSYHTSGTKSFASSSGDSKIWASDGTGIAIPDAPAGTVSAAFTGTWAPL